MLTADNIDAQEVQNIADLDFLYKSIKTLPSYRDQLKNDTAYRQLYERIRKDLTSNDEFEVYQKLLQLIYPIKDNHLGFYRKPDSTFRFKYLRLKTDPTELEAKFKNYPKDSLEGIYFRSNADEKYVVFRQKENLYYLQNLKTGLVEALLNKTGDQSIDAIRFLNPPLSYILYRNIKLSNGMLIGLSYQKLPIRAYAPVNFGYGNYEYKDLEQGIGYLRLTSFLSSNENIKVATDFFTKVRPTINTDQLIVDLRNNRGGGNKTSGQFAKFLKNYKGKIFILQNGITMSNAEQFIIDIKDKKDVTTLGESTRGTITYGSNYGKTIELPSNRFLFYPTDMSGRAEDLVFESIGVKPDVSLDAFTEDWISQTIKYIKTNYP
ncbi:MAG TPA: S41 family peptidase [Pedobacter sp.]|uniref:S41 family peptidase n=1 Tax=Pedobacter sp. TaxID=1411316 RepID=UPI002CA1CA2A|nr:S41 family peptidase [Pedobacter sp.]HMI02034.1 S41 family peptidase [Pedobacter sp.]